MRKWIVIGVVALTLAVVVVLALMRAANKRELAKEFAERREVTVAVEVARPEIGAIEETRMFLGSVVSTDQATVFSKIAGKVVSVPVAVGRRVGAGATIAVVDYDQPGMKYRYYYAYAPIPGEVTEVLVDVGDMVQPSTPLATVVKPESIKVETQVTAEALAVMSRGMSVKIHARGREGDVLEGKVVNLPRSLSEKALLIPPQAVHREAEGLAAYVAEGETVRRRLVETGLSREDAVEITSGLEPDDEVIVFTNGDLDDGIKINKKVPYKPHE
jgi:multidrug efflux pump subunit AcrA (membrane-fusion protein)